MGFLVVMVDSGRTAPLHLSAGSTSTGSNNLNPGTAPSRRFGCSLADDTQPVSLKYFTCEGRHRRLALELPKSSAHLLPAASVPYAPRG